MNTIVLDNPLIQHKLAIIRDKTEKKKLEQKNLEK